MNRGAKESLFQRLRKNRFLVAGVPFILMVVGGAAVLTTFTQSHVELKDKRYQSKSIREFNLEEEHKQIVSSLNIDDYQLSRVPRPEDSQNAAPKK